MRPLSGSRARGGRECEGERKRRLRAATVLQSPEAPQAHASEAKPTAALASLLHSNSHTQAHSTHATADDGQQRQARRHTARPCRAPICDSATHPFPPSSLPSLSRMRLLLLSLALVALLFLSSLDAASAAPPPPEVVLGVILPLSGPLALWGQRAQVRNMNSKHQA